MTRRLYIFLPGVRSDPADWRNWAPRMATAVNERCPHAKAEEFRYYAMAVTPKGKQNERVQYVLDLALRFFARGYSIIIVAHSNGAIIATEVAKLAPPIFESFHLIAAACDANFDRNGLNRALGSDGIVGHCTIYTGSRDWVLRWVAKAGGFLGYGNLGYAGPDRVDPAVANRYTVVPSDHDHCGWFDDAHFESTFQRITIADSLDRLEEDIE